MSAILTTRALTRRFAGITAVDQVSLTLNPGEIHALIGPNGAGKTTFVSMLIGRLLPTSGTIEFLGQNVTRLPSHQRVTRGMAYTFQITSVFANLSVFENVALACRQPRHRADASVPALLARVGLAGTGAQRANTLSYGHQRLLEVAMGLAGSPRLLILDEPTQGLADSEIEAFSGLIRSLVPATTVLLIEHNMRVVMQLAHRITVLNSGAVLAQGSPADVRANAAVQAAYLGTT